MIKDTDLPPLPPLVAVPAPAFTMRCLSDDAIRAIQREAYKAGMERAAQVCDLMERTSPRKPFREASAWLAQRIRALKLSSTPTQSAAGQADGSGTMGGERD